MLMTGSPANNVPQSTSNLRETGETDEPLNILFIQESPCIRNYKMAKALRGRGHQVSLGYTKGRLSQVYKGLSDDVYTQNIHLTNNRHLWDVSRHFDVVHCHNEPDILTVASLAGERPVIHDTHDLISLRANNDPNLAFFEGVANRGAAGRVYTTPYQLQEAQNLYGVNGHSIVLYNYVSGGDLPKRFLPKISAKDGGYHLVYEGGVGGPAHRDFAQLFFDLAAFGLHVHIYPSFYRKEFADLFGRSPGIHYHHPLSPREIMEEMTQYDAGIIPFNLIKGNKRFLDSTIANKLFEYLAAGLPVVTSPLESYVQYFRANHVGRVFSSARELVSLVPEIKEIAATTDLKSYAGTYEKDIPKLEALYRTVLAGNKPGAAPVRANPADHIAVTTKAPEPKGAPDLLDLVTGSILKLDAWILANGWAGYDPYDVRAHFLDPAVKKQFTPQQIEEILRKDQQDPGGVRRQLGIQPKVNAKAMGLLLGAYLILEKHFPGRSFQKQINDTETWLLNNPVPNMSGLCWGYPFDWESVVMIPAGTPTGVISYHVGDAFWQYYLNTGDQAWLDRCLDIARFMLNDLNRDRVAEGIRCFSYSPLDFFHVHNANLCISEFLVRLGRHTSQETLLETGKEGLNFARRDLEDRGYLTYWAKGYEPSPANVDQLDHYHTAADLRSLHRLSKLMPKDEQLRDMLNKYLSFYWEHYFDRKGRPKMHPLHDMNQYPLDIHAAAEAAYILGETAPDHETSLARLKGFLPWYINQLQEQDGSFIYKIRPKINGYHRLAFPFFRWAQAWSMRGLVSALRALSP